jgi:hypothetical protein
MPELSAAVQKLEVVDFHQCQMADVGAIHAPILDPPKELANSLLLVQKTNQLETRKKLDQMMTLWTFVHIQYCLMYFKNLGLFNSLKHLYLYMQIFALNGYKGKYSQR